MTDEPTEAAMSAEPAPAPPPIPVTVIGGYLGAGKTTLVNHLLRHPGGLRLAVLVNELGDLAIDADLIEARDDNLLSIAGGCICCSYGSDLMDALLALARRKPRPDHVLLETSGVALPGPVAGSLTLLADYRHDGTVILADAETIEARAADRYLADTIRRQLGEADLVLLNKADLVPPTVLAGTLAWLAAEVPGARVVTTSRAVVALDVLVGTRLERAARAPGFDLAPHVASLYATLVLEVPDGVDPGALAAGLAAPRCGLLRAKGFVTGHDGRRWAVEVVGARHEVRPVSGGPSGVRSAPPGRVVCIGLGAVLDRAAVLAQARA